MQNINRMPEIISLPKEEWEGAAIPMRYTTEEYFDVETEKSGEGYRVEIRRQNLDAGENEAFTKHFRTPEKRRFPCQFLK